MAHDTHHENCDDDDAEAQMMLYFLFLHINMIDAMMDASFFFSIFI